MRFMYTSTTENSKKKKIKVPQIRNTYFELLETEITLYSIKDNVHGALCITKVLIANISVYAYFTKREVGSGRSSNLHKVTQPEVTLLNEPDCPAALKPKSHP